MDSVVAADTLRSASTGELMKPLQLLNLFRRNLLLIGICVLVGAVLAFVYASSLPKIFTAYADVAVEGDRMAIPELRGALQTDNSPDPMPIVHTEVQALGARQLMNAVVQKLRLDRDPEFNAALRPPTLMGTASGWVKSVLTVAHPKGTQAGIDDSLLNVAMRNLVITQDNRSLVIGVGFSSQDPVLSANVVNTLIAEYVRGRGERRASATLGANTAMSKRIDQVRADIDRIETQMRDLRSKSDQVNLRAGSVGQQQVEDLANAASQATLERSQIEANWERASSLSAGGSSDALASVLGSTTISRLREQEAQAASRVADLSQRYGSAYPELKSAQADLSAAHRQISLEARRIVDSLQTQLRVARAHETDVTAKLNAARHTGVIAQNIQAQLDQLQQDATTRRDLYRTLLERAQQTETQPVGSETPDVRILSAATAPGSPSAPNMKIATGGGGVGGGLLACIGLLAFTRRSKGPFAAAEFARQSGLNVIAVLRGKTVRTRLEDQVLDSTGRVNDAMRDALGRLGQMSRQMPRVIVFTSPQAGTLHGSVALAFARGAALQGKTVLLIEADRQAIGTSAAMGSADSLSDVLSGTMGLRDAVAADRVHGLDLLTGTETPNAVLSGQAVGLENLLVEAREDYDLVVLGAPEYERADTSVFVRSGDVTVLVLDERAARFESAEASVARLRELTHRPLAAFLFVPAGSKG